MGLTFQFLCNIVLYSIRLYFHHQSHPQRGLFWLWLWLYFLFLELSLHCFPIVYCAPTTWGVHLSLSYLFAFSYGSVLPFPSPVNQVLPEFPTMTHPSWIALHVMVHSFIELDKAVVHVISLASFL